MKYLGGIVLMILILLAGLIGGWLFIVGIKVFIALFPYMLALGVLAAIFGLIITRNDK